jgi:hypothetical protein
MEGIEIALIGRGELPVWGKAAPLRIGLKYLAKSNPVFWLKLCGID